MSRLVTINVTQSLRTETCFSCHMIFAVPEEFYVARVADHKNFYCPNGHAQHYTGKTEAQKLRDELAHVNQRLEWKESARKAALDQAETAERRRRAAVGQNTKLKKRIANGVCPCCHRSFPNLRDHIAGEHPDYVEGSMVTDG